MNLTLFSELYINAVSGEKLEAINNNDRSIIEKREQHRGRDGKRRDRELGTRCLEVGG